MLLQGIPSCCPFGVGWGDLSQGAASLRHTHAATAEAEASSFHEAAVGGLPSFHFVKYTGLCQALMALASRHPCEVGKCHCSPGTEVTEAWNTPFSPKHPTPRSGPFVTDLAANVLGTHCMQQSLLRHPSLKEV